MPLPIAHALFGATTARLTVGRNATSPVRLALFGALGVLPDLDLLLVAAGVRGVHRGFSHSFVFAAVLGVLTFVIWRSRHFALAAALATASHGLLDTVTSSNGGGVKLLWPFIDTRYKLGAVSFSEFPAGYSFQNLAFWCGVEVVVFGALLLLAVKLTTLHAAN